MNVGGDRNFYTILTVMVLFVLGMITVIYVYMRRQQKIFEDAVGEIKEEALKHLRDRASIIPITPHEEVVEEPIAETQASETQQTNEPEILQPKEGHENEEPTTQEQNVSEVEIPNPVSSTILNFKTSKMVNEYVQTATSTPLPTATKEEELGANAEPAELKNLELKFTEPAPKKRGRKSKTETQTA